MADDYTEKGGMVMCWPGPPGQRGLPGSGVVVQTDQESAADLHELLPELIGSMQKALDEGKICGYGGAVICSTQTN